MLPLPLGPIGPKTRRLSQSSTRRDDLEEPLLPSTPGRAESWAEGSIQVPRSDMEWLRQWLLGRKLEQPNFGTPRVDEVDVVGVSGENSRESVATNGPGDIWTRSYRARSERIPSMLKSSQFCSKRATQATLPGKRHGVLLHVKSTDPARPPIR